MGKESSVGECFMMKLEFVESCRIQNGRSIDVDVNRVNKDVQF